MKDTFLPYAKPDLDGSELRLIEQALDSAWLTTGQMAHQFEREFAHKVGALYAVAVNSCTAALHLALDAVGLGPGDEVITTPYTFASTAEVIRYFGARPRFVDIRRDTFNIDSEQAVAAINSRTKAIIPVHIGGHPADLEPLDKAAQEHGLALIEDAAHALPASYQGTPIGTRRAALGASPHLICYSFYATKTLTTGEGGMVCTDNESLAERCRLMSLHGISKDAWNRYAQGGSWYYEIEGPGFKYNMTDIAAAMGLAQLVRLDIMHDRRRQIAARYGEAFAAIPSLELPTVLDNVDHSWHLYSLRLNFDRLTIDRARFIDELQARNIGTSVHFIPLHIHPYYRNTYGYVSEDFPVAFSEYLRQISLPIYSAMSDDDVEDVVQAVSDVAHTFGV